MLRIRTLGTSEITIGDERICPEQRNAFVLILLLATRGPVGYSRGELASLLWPDAPEHDRNHRLRSLLHRLRRLDVPLACSSETVALLDATLDVAMFARPPRTLAEAREGASLIGPVLPNFHVTSPPALADRLDDERDVIIATLIRWLRSSLGLATSAGDWALVEILSRLTLTLDETAEDAWLRLAEAQLLLSGSIASLRTLDEYAARVAPPEPSVPIKILRHRIESHRIARVQSIDDLPLIGQDDVVRRIWSAIARARDGYGGSIVLWGPAGVGKTRVLREIERVRMIETVRVVRVAARPVHALQPFGFVVELIAQLLDEPGAAGCEPEAFATLRRIASLPNAAREAESPDRYFDAFTELLAALSEEATTIVSMDDMHLVEAPVWRFWSAVFRWSIGHRVHWLLCYRALHESELSSLPERGLLQRLSLRCLERTDAARLVDAARSGYSPIDFDQIFRRVGGHPALLAALVRSEGELPRWTESIVGDWVARMSGDQFRILHTLATLGGAATTRSLLDLGLGRGEVTEALGDLVRQGIIQISNGIVSTYDIWANAALGSYADRDRVAVSID